MNRGVESVLLLEDDAIFGETFTEDVKKFLSNVPANWGMIYLGGQHLKVREKPPKRLNPEVFIPYNVNRTHAFAIRGKCMEVIYKHLNTQDWTKRNHIDNHLGRFHQERNKKYPVYCPKNWLVGQREGQSNIAGREVPPRFWA